MASQKKRSVAPSLILGFVLALIEMGLPMIGMSVNLPFGALLLFVAFALFAWGLWNWETNLKYGRVARGITLVVVGLIYFGLMGYQIHSQYKKYHPSVVVTPPPSLGPVPQLPPAPQPKCSGSTGDATARGGSIANSGNCVDDLSTGQKKNIKKKVRE
jgi:hypothetical protein